MKFILTTLAFCLVLTRFYLIYKVLYWSFINYQNNNPNLNELIWVVVVMFLDIYLCVVSKEYNTKDS
jgi:hypothetical protein